MGWTEAGYIPDHEKILGGYRSILIHICVKWNITWIKDRIFIIEVGLPVCLG